MKKVTTVLSMVFLGASFMSFSGKDDCKTDCDSLRVKDITFIEEEEEIDLGLDTALYLPEGFDAYVGMETVLDDIDFIEKGEEINIGFNTLKYLPNGFNAYDGMVFKMDDITFIEEQEEINLGLDFQNYLPKNFNAFSK